MSYSPAPYRHASLGAGPSAQDTGQTVLNVANVVAGLVRDPEGTLRVQGPGIVSAVDRHLVGPVVDSVARASAPYVLRYVLPALGVLYLLSGAAAYFSFEVLRQQGERKMSPNRRRRRRRRVR